jgi:UDP-glucose 4-epimerase
MRVFITGICSLLGSHLGKELLRSGHEVYGNDLLLCDTAANWPHQFAHVDCKNQTAMSKMFKHWKPDVVVHTAAIAAEGFSVFSPAFVTANIYQASVSTFSAAIANGATRIVHMTSMARYGGGEPPFKEDMPTNPLDPYAQAKVASEQTLRTLCETHGVKWSIVCPHNVIGSGQEVTPYRNVVSIFLNRLKLGLPVYIYGDGEQKRCFSPVIDCLHSLVRVVNGDADAEVVNIGPDGGEITINELLSMCESITGITANRVYLPPRPVTDTVKNAYCSSDKARRLLGYEPQQSLYDCIKEMSDAMIPKPFTYRFPIEIESGKCPRTWAEKL